MNFILVCSLFINFIFASDSLIKKYKNYKNKNKNNNNR